MTPKVVGLIADSKDGENRVALIPRDVKYLISKGIKVNVEYSAGRNCGFTDNDYESVGATLMAFESVVKNSDIITKVKEPTIEEVESLLPHNTFFSFLHLEGNPILEKKFLECNAVGYSFESVYSNETNTYSLLRPMSVIAGKMSCNVAIEFFMKTGRLLGNMVGSEKTRVVVAGAGASGSESALLFSAMGCVVTVFDKSKQALALLHNKDNRIEVIELNENTSLLDYHQTHVADVIVGAVYVPQNSPAKLIKEEEMYLLKDECLLIDISIDQGGCFDVSTPTSHSNPFLHLDKKRWYYGVPNIPGRVQRTASEELSKELCKVLFSLSYQLNLHPSVSRDGKYKLIRTI